MTGRFKPRAPITEAICPCYSRRFVLVTTASSYPNGHYILGIECEGVAFIEVERMLVGNRIDGGLFLYRSLFLGKGFDKVHPVARNGQYL